MLRAHSRARVCILTSVHSPSDVRIFRKEATSLAAAGYDVSIVAPHGQDEMLDAVQIKAVPVVKGRLQRMTRTAWRVYKVGLKQRANVYHFHDPELIPVGLLLKGLGKCVVYDVHEDLPRDILDKDWIAEWLRRPVAWVAGLFEVALASFFDAVIAATPSIARRFPKEHTETIQNYPIEQELKMSGAAYADRPLLMAYVGGVSKIRGARQLVEAMEFVPPDLEARCAIAGNVDPPELEKELSSLAGCRAVDWLGWRSRQEVASLLSRARIGVLAFQPVANHTESLPTKLFEYMSAGIPVIASDFPVWRKIIDSAGCGLLVDPSDPRAIAEAAVWLFGHPEEAEQMGRRGATAVKAHYTWSGEQAKLLGLYSRLFGRGLLSRSMSLNQ